MARPAVISVEDKFRLVLSVVSGEMTVAEAARRSKVSEQSIGNWKRQFLEGGKQGLADGGEFGADCHPLVTDLVALGALQLLGEEDLLAACGV